MSREKKREGKRRKIQSIIDIDIVLILKYLKNV